MNPAPPLALLCTVDPATDFADRAGLSAAISGTSGLVHVGPYELPVTVDATYLTPTGDHEPVDAAVRRWARHAATSTPAGSSANLRAVILAIGIVGKVNFLTPWIADLVGLSQPVVRRYLRDLPDLHPGTHPGNWWITSLTGAPR